MDSPALELIFLSQRRTDILLFLKKGPKTIAEINEYLNLSSVAVLPQLKKLRDNFLIFKEGNIYSLSPLGLATVSKMQPMVDLLNVFGIQYDYWTSHSIKCIPAPLLERIGELSSFVLSEPPDKTRLYEPHRDWLENVKKSKKLSGICSIFNPLFTSSFRPILDKRIEISVLVTPQVYERLKKEFGAYLREFFTIENTSFYVCREKIEFTHVVTDSFLSLTLPFSDGTYDPEQHIFCFDSAAIRWGEDLFAYYRDRSEKITKI